MVDFRTEFEERYQHLIEKQIKLINILRGLVPNNLHGYLDDSWTVNKEGSEAYIRINSKEAISLSQLPKDPDERFPRYTLSFWKDDCKTGSKKIALFDISAEKIADSYISPEINFHGIRRDTQYQLSTTNLPVLVITPENQV